MANQVAKPRTPKHAPAARAAKTGVDGAVSRYFHDISAHRVLTPEEETALAQDIESLEVEVWRRILSFAPAVPHVVDTLTTSLAEPPDKPLRAVARAAARVRAGAAGKPQARLERAAATAAAAVRAADTDKELLTDVVAELCAYEGRSQRDARTTHIECSGKRRDYRAYVARVRRAHSAAARARDAFVRANLRLVISIARRYAKGPMGLADLIQEGNLGLLKAVDRFDYRRGFRFSTYASWWIRHSVGRALADRGREVRVPVHMVDANYRLKKAKRELISKLGREPNETELAAAVEIPIEKLQQMSQLLLGNPVSMNQPVSNDDDRPMVEVFQDPNAEHVSPEDVIDRDIIRRELRAVIGSLTPIETDIVRRRFGLEGEREHTLQEIADSYERSRERIRQIQAGALKKLRLALSRRDIRAA